MNPSILTASTDFGNVVANCFLKQQASPIQMALTSDYDPWRVAFEEASTLPPFFAQGSLPLKTFVSRAPQLDLRVNFSLQPDNWTIWRALESLVRRFAQEVFDAVPLVERIWWHQEDNVVRVETILERLDPSERRKVYPIEDQYLDAMPGIEFDFCVVATEQEAPGNVTEITKDATAEFQSALP